MTVLTQPTTAAGKGSLLGRRPSLVGYVVGWALVVAGTGVLASAGAEALARGPRAQALAIVGAAVGAAGALLRWRIRAPDHASSASVFAAVLSGWLVFCLVATLPYLATHALGRFDLALFESISSVTTTSSSAFARPEGVPTGILFWRALTQWLGGMAAIVFAVSVLPTLGIGGMELIRPPAQGSSADRLGRRIRTEAARLVPVYVGFTLVVGVAYRTFGMSSFDAVAHAFTTVSTGGMSTHTRSFAAFHSPALEWTAVVAMVLAGGSYVLYWRALRGKPLVIVRSGEFRAYLAITAAIGAAAVAWTASSHRLTANLVRRTIFTTVSVTSTTGFRMLDTNRWAPAVQLLLVFAMGLGAMAASAAGGFKVFRLVAVLSYARRQLFGQLHPRAVSVIRFGRDIVPEAAMNKIVGFFGLFMAIGGAATFLVAALGRVGVSSAVSAVASAIGNVGPGLGTFGPWAGPPSSAGVRAVLMVVMLCGRLDVFPVLLGAVPLFRFIGDRLPARLSQAILRLFRG